MPRLQATILAGAIAFSTALLLSLLMAASVRAAPALAGTGTHDPIPGIAVGNPAGSAGVGLAMPGQHDPLSIDAIVAAQVPITCTVTTTTTDEIVGNNSFATAATLATYNNLSLLAISPAPPGPAPTLDDYFRLDNATPGFKYTVEAIPNGTGNYNLGLIVYDKNFTPVLTDTNTLDGVSARVELFAVANASPYYFRVTQISSSCSGGTYRLVPTAAAPTSTPTNTPGPTATSTSPVTPIPGADRYEPNFNFDVATLFALGVKYTNLNFAPWAGSDPNAPDNDFYKIYVKPGLLVTCETLELAPGVDTNLILYDNNTNGIGGNEDIDRAAGNFASRVTYYVTYEGWLYALVGNVYPIDPRVAANFTYSFQCYIGSGPTATPTMTRVPVTPPTPIPTLTPTPSPIPTLTPTPTPTPPSIVVDVLPTATPLGQQAVVVPISLLVYYDLNDNRTPDPGEGVVGISARVIDVITGQELQHGFTDANGFVSLTTRATGVVRLVVPYLSYSVVIQPSGSQITLRIAPSDLPDSIP